MKRQLLLIALLFAGFGLFAQDAPETQKSLITKVSATWCPPCGGWGWDMFENLIAENSTNAILINAHHSGDLETSTSDAFATNLNFSGQPKFFLNNADQFATSSNADAKVLDITAAVNTAAQNAPVVNTGMVATHDMENITVVTSTEFFQAATGDYKLALYIINDGYVGYQASRGNNVLHEKVLADAFTTDAFGETISTGSVDAGTIINGTYSIAINPDWDIDKLEIAAIIWSVDGSSNIFENGNVTSQIDLATNTENIEVTQISAKFQPSILTTQTNLVINLTEATSAMNIKVLSAAGQLHKSITLGNLTEGTHDVYLDRADLAGAGLYLVLIETDHGQLVKKLVVN